MEKIVTAFVLAVIRHKGKYLLTRRQAIGPEDPKEFHNKWQLPGGGIDFGETAEKAVIREVKEEVGLDIEIITLVPYVINALRTHWQGHGIIFLSRPKKVNFKVKINRESDSYNWFDISEIKSLRSLPGVKEAIRACYNL